MIWLVLILVVAVLLYAVVAAGGRRTPHSSHHSSFDRQLVAERWAAAQTLAEHPGGYKQAIFEADKLLDYVLKGLGCAGNTLAERLKRGESRLSDRNAVWRAHKLRNALAHEVGFEVTAGHAREALRDFEQGLRDLGAL